MWIGSYFLEGDDVNDAMRIAKFGLWYGGLGIELGSTILIWLCCRVTGFRKTHLAERFSTLTLLILGEGVIGYSIALQSSLSFSEMVTDSSYWRSRFRTARWSGYCYGLSDHLFPLGVLLLDLPGGCGV
jgi:low temperature requirement protein LtrA